ncbi:MAG TPA: GNAT family N-acetyltransferase [Gammaproteobacteria bacterium]|nr:GNAT family N-acetyltransferase [Gammaproteobacteria bacterium]
MSFYPVRINRNKCSNKTGIDVRDKPYSLFVLTGIFNYIFTHFPAKTILIDPAATNKRAIRCYEKAGFSFVREAFDGVTDCYILQKIKQAQ